MNWRPTCGEVHPFPCFFQSFHTSDTDTVIFSASESVCCVTDAIRTTAHNMYVDRSFVTTRHVPDKEFFYGHVAMGQTGPRIRSQSEVV
jgi:hypothetical protein